MKRKKKVSSQFPLVWRYYKQQRDYPWQRWVVSGRTFVKILRKKKIKRILTSGFDTQIFVVLPKIKKLRKVVRSLPGPGGTFVQLVQLKYCIKNKKQVCLNSIYFYNVSTDPSLFITNFGFVLLAKLAALTAHAFVSLSANATIVTCFSIS